MFIRDYYFVIGMFSFLNRTFILLRFLSAELPRTSLSTCEPEMDTNRTAKVRIMTLRLIILKINTVRGLITCINVRCVKLKLFVYEEY